MSAEGRDTEGARQNRGAEKTGDRVGEDRTVVTRRDDRDVRGDRGGLGLDRDRQRDEYGGFNIGAAFFGWLVATGLAVLLIALLSAAGAAIGISELNSTAEAKSSADTLSIIGGALLILVLAIGYFAGGYVAGRMSRFDGARQGLGVWAIGLLVTLIVAILGVIGGSKYNIFSSLNLPNIPVDDQSLATGGLIALAAILIATLIAAVLGGKAGERYHVKVDRVGLHRD